MAKSITMYICDGRACKGSTLYCRAHGHKNWLCQHTTNAKNAKNGVCDEPWKHPDRFKKEAHDKRVYFIEKEGRS